MDTLILLESSKRHMSFLGEVFDKRLVAILAMGHPLAIHVVKTILGKEFLMAFHRHRVNTNVTAMFLAMVLTTGEPKDGAKVLC